MSAFIQMILGRFTLIVFLALCFSVFNLSGKEALVTHDILRNAPYSEPISSTSLQGKVRISGKVTDVNGTPIIGASVIEKGTNNGDITDENGVFSLQVEKEASITVAFLGYLSVEQQVLDRTYFSIVLRDDTKTLDEVVVVGYGTQRKSDITSAVSVIDMKNIGDVPVSNSSRLILGQAPGVVVKQSSGTPGKEMDITIRGTGSLGADSAPLYVVDGFPVGTSLGQSLNPEDIESISNQRMLHLRQFMEPEARTE